MTAAVDDLANGLTAAQREAVEFFQGPLLVLAGPGSGKTRVITRRIARLVERGVSPRNILAITFTNRAAREMQERVEHLLPGTRLWVSTFHRFCASILRRQARQVGLDTNFVIFDKSDQLEVVKHVLYELDLDPTRTPASKVGARISRIKNSLTDPDQFVRSIEDQVGEPFDAVVAQIYPRYQSALLESNAVDFDDLLLHVVRLFSENPELREEYDERFRYLLVDEYQDTNPAQYQIVRALSLNYQNVCVTGDPDQSIYGWRGAHIENILNFERDYPNAKLIRLEHNFRSTGCILDSADRLIAHNRMRKAKVLITSKEQGEPVRLLRYLTSHQEADGIARQIARLGTNGAKWSDCAIFFRVNSMSRELELALTRHRIPHQVAAGSAFYERAEIRDLLAYLRLIENPVDQLAFQRIVNRPARGIGASTVARLQQWAADNRLSLLEAARDADAVPGLSKTARVRLKSFVKMMSGFSLADTGSVSQLLKKVVEKTAYAQMWIKADTEQAIERRSNVEELINAAAQFDEVHGDDVTLSGFLETTALVSDADGVDPSSGRVTLMTMHAAKGLEFPHVFIVGLEHGLIPHERAIRSGDSKQYEEERRLLFVGMTRAMRQLFLTTARMRASRGTPQMTIPSTFLGETTYKAIEIDDPADDLGTVPTDVTMNDESSEALSEPDTQQIDDSDASAAATESSACVVRTRNVTNRNDEENRRADLKRRLRETLATSDRPLLTTGAALLSGQPDSVPLPQIFAVGMRVRHPQYGTGTVTDVSGFSKRRTVTVEFLEPARSETFIAAHCPLQPVGIR